MGIFKTIKRMLGLGSKKSRSKKKEEEEAAAKSRDSHFRSNLIEPSTSQTSSFTEFREIYTDWAINSCSSSDELQLPNRSTSDSSFVRYEHTSDYTDYYSIDTNSTRLLRQVAIPAVTDDDDVTKYAMYVHGEESAEVGADLSFESRELTYYGLSDFSSDDEIDIADHYYDVIHSRQTDRGDDHTGVSVSPPTLPPITSIPVSRRSSTDNSIGTNPPTAEFIACDFRSIHTTTSVISNKRGIIPPTPGYLLSYIDTDYPVSEVTTSDYCTDHPISEIHTYDLENDDFDINNISGHEDYDNLFPKVENIIWKVGPNDNISMGVNIWSCDFQY